VKILELYLKAYGPFTERRIELGSGAPGLHVIFGRNEAGKSSALRAIHHLLYGIPARSSDDFLHDYPSMRIGGRLRDSDGRELAFLRKKGSKNTLRSWDDADAMDDATLEPFLRGVPDELFGSFFGIDHATLVEGGQSLLEEQGDLGKSLFAAGLGSGNLRKVISGLEDEAKALFAARASKPSINAGLARLKQIQSEIKQGALKPRDWEAHDSAFSEAEDELRGIQSELGGLRGEHNRLQRLGSVLPLLGQRRHALESIEAMGEVISLDEGFEERLQAALQTRRDQGEARSRALEAVDEIAKKLAELALDPALSQQREVVESFRERFGSYKTASAQLPRREGGRERLGEELAAALAALGTHVAVEQLDELRAPLARRRQIQELASEYGVLQTRAENALETLREGTGKQEAARAELAALPAVRDGAELGRVLAAARKLGDVDGQASSLALRCQRARRACHDDLAALGLWSGSLEELERAAIPALETLERFQGGFDALEKEREKLGAGRQKAADEIRDVDARLETLRGSGAVPSEEELAGERERRDAGWRLVRRRWVDASAPDTAVDVAEAEAASSGGAAPAHDTLDADISAFAGGDALPTAYEGSVASADETADRLRREADRVAAQAELLGRRGRAEQALEEAGNELTQVAERESTLAREWRDIWQTVQIEPNPPREMLAWLRRQQTLLGAAAEARKQEDALSELTGARASGRGALLASLRRLGEAVEGEAVEEGGEEETGEELADVVARADEMLQSIEALERRRRELDAALEEGERKLEAAANDEREAQERLSCWRDEWSVAVDGLGLSDGARPASALDRLDTLTGLFQKQHDIADLDLRIAGMRRDLDEFETQLGDFVALHAPDLADLPPEQTVQRLAGTLAAIDKEEALRAQYLEQREQQGQRARHAERDFEAAEAQLSRLREEAGCSDDASVDEALQSWKAWRKTRQRVAEFEEQLIRAGGGASIAELESEAREVDPDSLPAQRDALQEQIDELEATRTKLMGTRAGARAELDRMDGSARVAAAAEGAQELLAALRRDVERYVELRLARAILEREIEHYRKEHQAPLLVRARELFSALTLGEHSSLQTHYDEDDRPQLVALRADGRSVGVEGMSSGTRDQLFLALRLATLEEYLARSEPMPFIVDDILVNFDDERARATLEVLAELATRTQVLLFTHHGRIREHAKELGDRASVLELGAS